MPVEQHKDRIILKHPTGASVEVLFFGATVISWISPSYTDSEPQERLFLSSKAFLDGSRPVRGGIPIVFPCFGTPSHPDHAKLSQHGFARSEVWDVDRVLLDNEAGVSVRLTLTPTPKIRAVYDRPFHLDYVVTLAGHQLSTDLHVKNTASSPQDTLEFQALFHTYIRAPSAQALITPLRGLLYYDKTEITEEGKTTAKEEHRDGVDVHKFTDSVYENAPQSYRITWPDGGLKVRSKELKDIVVWNPQQEAGSKLSDMEDGGWNNFVGLEPGYVRGFVALHPGRVWIGQQVLTVLDTTNV